MTHSLTELVTQLNDFTINIPLKEIKHRCPNCGATKVKTNDCEYCGT